MSLLQARIYDAEKQKQEKEQAAERKSLVGGGDRSERIRTYNFPQGRLTDHRINLTLYKLDEILGIKHKSETKTHEKVAEILEEIRKEVNKNISSFSRIKKVIEQREEFVKTPTKKIKRYLYV